MAPQNKERATDYSRAYMAMARLAHGEAGLHIVFSRILVLPLEKLGNQGELGRTTCFLSFYLFVVWTNFGSSASQQLQGSPAVGDAYGFHAALLVRWILRQPACWIRDAPLVPGRGCLEEATRILRW